MLGARSSDIQLHREVTMTAYNLSLAEKNKLIIAASPLMGALITLMLSCDEDTAAFACASVANIAENSDTHGAIAEQRGLRFFLEFEAQGAPARVAHEAVKCVANLSSNYALHDLLLADGCHEFLVRAIQHPDPKTRLFGVVGLGNLVSNPQTIRECCAKKWWCRLLSLPAIQSTQNLDSLHCSRSVASSRTKETTNHSWTTEFFLRSSRLWTRLTTWRRASTPLLRWAR